MRPLAVVALCAAMLSVLAGCESNQERSAKIARQGQHRITVGAALHIAKPDPDVRVVSTAVVSGGGSTAVAVQLHNAGTTAQAALPIVVVVRNAAGKSVYTNTAAGLAPTLQHVTSIAPGATAWWVDDQVLARGAKTATAVVGAGRAVPAVPAVVLSASKVVNNGSGPAATGTLTNHSGKPLTSTVVSVVALHGSTVVAAGESIVATLAAAPNPVADAFTAYFVGTPTGATLSYTVAPTPPT